MSSSATAKPDSHAGSGPALQARIGLAQGVALYVSAILGAGVLVLPGQAASLAGPASLVAWAFCCLLGVPLAATFASLAARMPDTGGVATYTGAAFGSLTGGITGWWYLIAGAVGESIVPLTGGYYLASALGLSSGWAYVAGGTLLAAAVAGNLAGTRVTGTVQLVLAAGVAAILILACAAGFAHARPAALDPFAPHGVTGIGRAVDVLFYAFAGWEAVAHLSGEFRDPRRDLPRATAITIGIVSVLYLGIAAAVVLTGAYGSANVDHIAVGRLLSGSFGLGAVDAAAVAAVVISLGTANAFVASVSRLAYALARDGWLPAPVGRLSRRDVPAAGIWLVGGIGGAGLLIAWAGGWGTQQLVVIPSTLVIGVYLLSTAAAAKLSRGRDRWLAVAAFVLTACAVPFAAGNLLIPVLVTLAALCCRYVSSRRKRG